MFPPFHEQAGGRMAAGASAGRMEGLAERSWLLPMGHSLVPARRVALCQGLCPQDHPWALSASLGHFPVPFSPLVPFSAPPLQVA